jgi:chemotaxis protein methyltransferase CheR
MSTFAYFDTITQRLNQLFGLHYNPSQLISLETNLRNAAKALQRNDSLPEIAGWLSQAVLSDHEMNLLANFLTIGETYFFREKKAIELFQTTIIPETFAAGKSKNMRIWSAGCSSGEEPYTLAIVCREMFDNISDCAISIHATDISSRALQKAREGVYTPWSFRETPEFIKSRYFSESGKNFLLKPEIMKMVKFGSLNLATTDFDKNPAFQMMDVIFCRNVLMYFSAEVIARVTEKFYNCLRPGGWLITSQVELNDEWFGAYKRVMFDNGIYYQKADKNTENKTAVPATERRKSGLNPQKSDRRITLTPAPTFRAAKVEHATKSIIIKAQPTVAELKEKVLNARALLAAAKYEQCVSVCQALIKKHGPDTGTAFLLAEALANAGRLDEAEQVMARITESDQAEAIHFFMYANILYELNRLDDAGKCLTKTLYLNPNHLAARFTRSKILLKMGENEAAAKETANLLRDLEQYSDEESLPFFEGLTAGRLRQTVHAMKGFK